MLPEVEYVEMLTRLRR